MSRRFLFRRVRLDLLWTLLAFAVLQLALAALVEHCLPDVRDPEWTAKLARLRARRAERPNAALVVMLGSSRASMGFRAADCDGPQVLAFNAALSGAGPMLELIALRRLLAAGVRPDLLLVEVVPYHFNQPADCSLEERTLNGSRLRQAEVAFLRPYLASPERLSRQWWKARLLPGVQQHAELRDRLGLDTFAAWANSDDDLRLMDGHGWHPRFLEPNPPLQQKDRAQALAKYTAYSRRFRCAERPAQALADLLALARKEGIAVRLVLMPEDTGFRELPSPEVQAGTEQFLAEICRTWQVPLIDARAWVRDEDFWDGHHLLPTGAAVFTSRLAESGCLTSRSP